MRRPDGDRGQVSIEFLGMTPLIILTLVLMWQAVLVGYAYTLAGNAADEAVRRERIRHGRRPPQGPRPLPRLHRLPGHRARARRSRGGGEAPRCLTAHG